MKKYDVIRVFRFTLATAHVAQALGSSMENTAPRPGADRNAMLLDDLFANRQA